ncbi:hypothetical protein [Idiomarina sp.]|nr:hypothetical protein [Idiomarina sp.]
MNKLKIALAVSFVWALIALPLSGALYDEIRGGLAMRFFLYMSVAVII